MRADIGHDLIRIVCRIQQSEEILVIEKADQLCHGCQMGGVIHGAEGEDVFDRIVFLIAETYGLVQDTDPQRTGDGACLRLRVGQGNMLGDDHVAAFRPRGFIHIFVKYTVLLQHGRICHTDGFFPIGGVKMETDDLRPDHIGQMKPDFGGSVRELRLTEVGEQLVIQMIVVPDLRIFGDDTHHRIHIRLVGDTGAQPLMYFFVNACFFAD